ncbi:hypothetical protein P4159_06035 [Bacillus thuringiensis]|uniref:hypothetical protein n=1 Tax=Bacillus cereus group TaxID=86661 RepID=UPI000CD99D86|nr:MULTISPECIES: hypothetical protein [Bacillus cereus group]MEC3420524.1 hypothetical protein [Bacillus cereus]MEC3596934.1 hypothetical protein [Bacillus thuringiensis]MED1574283.1 hypothetical protein [Bacillus paranthracis]MED1836207.1 hypothetical protein [Bacillus thuringiensis]MED2670270.1 hypothetical protein [Bacillus thuringiensis]
MTYERHLQNILDRKTRMVSQLQRECDALKEKVEELEKEGEAYEVEHEMNDGTIIRMDYATYHQFMKDMAAGAFNGNG